jgi:hypothetical protein
LDSRISITESFEHADSLSDATVRALQSATLMLGEIERGTGGAYEKRFKEISLSALGPDFLSPKLSAAFGPIKLVGVSKLPSGWEILVEGQWKAKLTLNDKYELTSWVRLP